jgi:8-oxo-dGTP diphosphatase
MSKEKLFHVGVKALITDYENNILLLKSPGWKKEKIEEHWDIPGGRVEEGNTLIETLNREIKEETGITEIINEEFITAVVSNHKFTIESGHNVGLVLFIYEVDIPDNVTIKLSDEHTAYEWVDKREAARRLENKYPPAFTKILAK